MKRIITAALLAAALAGPAGAGRSCQAKPLDIAALDRGLQLAARTASALEASGARVAVLARAGQDLTRYGLVWSHIGIAYREPTSGRWRVVHKLNQCGSARADVYRQGLGEFFRDDPWQYEAAFVALKLQWGATVLETLTDNSRLARLHQSAYSMVAYPWAQTYQQSNQWALETLASALEPGATSRERAQAWLQLKDYQPTTLRLDALTRLGARMTAANVAFDDHPNAKRFSDRIETVSADSVFDWLQRSGLGEPIDVVR